MEDQDYNDHLALREAKGREEGQQAAKEANARNLLAQGVATVVIAAATGLTEAEKRVEIAVLPCQGFSNEPSRCQEKTIFM